MSTTPTPTSTPLENLIRTALTDGLNTIPAGLNLVVNARDLVSAITAALQSAPATAPAPASPSQLLTKAQAMDRFGVCDSTLYRWEQQGYLRPRRLGRRIYYAPSDIEEALNR